MHNRYSNRLTPEQQRAANKRWRQSQAVNRQWLAEVAEALNVPRDSLAGQYDPHDVAELIAQNLIGP